MNRVLLAIMLVCTLIGCAEIPPRIAHPPIDDLQLEKALSNIKGNIGHPIRWGGTVLTVSEKDEKTWIEVRQHQLDENGVPLKNYDSKGRFLIKTERQLEKLPMLIGMVITVFGELSGSFEGTTGYEPYLFPVVDAKEYYFWDSENLPVYVVPYPYSYRYGYGYYPYYSSFYPNLYRSRYLYGFNYSPWHRYGVHYW